MSNKILITDHVRADTFVSIFQNAKIFSDHINIIFEASRLYVQCMDASKISVFELILAKEWFDGYELEEGKSVTIGINTIMLYRVLSTRSKGQDVVFAFDDGGENLFIEFKSDDKSSYNKEFAIPLMEIEDELMSIPDSESTAIISLPSSNFADIVKHMKLFGDTMEIKCDQESVAISSNSGESGKMDVKISTDDLSSYEITEDEEVKATYNLNIMYNVSLYSKLSGEIEMHITEGAPIKLVYRLHDTIEDAKLRFFLAPKIEE